MISIYRVLSFLKEKMFVKSSKIPSNIKWIGFICLGMLISMSAVLPFTIDDIFILPSIVFCTTGSALFCLDISETKKCHNLTIKRKLIFRILAYVQLLLLFCFFVLLIAGITQNPTTSEWHTVRNEAVDVIIHSNTVVQNDYVTLNTCINNLRYEYDRYPIYYRIMPAEKESRTIRILSWAETADCIQSHTYTIHNGLYKLKRSSNISVIHPRDLRGKETGTLS